ncbi:MAG: glucosidase family protein [Armatimonadota bacterium]
MLIASTAFRCLRIGLALWILICCADQSIAGVVSGQKSRPGVVKNQYFKLTVDRSKRLLVSFDPTGKANYNPNPVVISPVGVTSNGSAVMENGVVRIKRSRYCCPGGGVGGYPGPFDHGEEIQFGESLGQGFTVSPGGGWLCDVWAFLTCSGVKDSSVTMVLRKDGPSGQIIASRDVRPLPNECTVHLTLSKPVPPGVYYLEVGNRRGCAYWWGCNKDAYPGGTAFISGQAHADKDWVFGYGLADIGVLDWEVRLENHDLRFNFAVREQAVKGFTPALAINFPWRLDGYDTTNPAFTPFRYITTDSGYWLPVEAFKRLKSDWVLQPDCNWARLRGTRGYDLKIQHNRKRFEARMESDQMHVLLGADSRLELLPTSDVLPDYFPRFFTSDNKINDTLNRFMLTFMFRHTSCPSTYEFDALKLAWVGGPMHDSFQRVLQFYTNRVDNDGYIWSRPESRGWDGSDSLTVDHRHYDNNVHWLLACWDYYSWTGDQALLKSSADTVRKATDYLLNSMNGRSGLLTMNSPQHTGVCVPKGNTWSSGYFDCIPAGYRDAYINSLFTPALHASAELERASGNEARANELERIAAVAKQEFNKAFWDDAKGRYVSWIDSTGAVHDWGMTYVNTMAATYGLADQQQANRMFDWMENEATSSGVPDTFSRWVFAPRSNTIHCSDQANNYKYDKWCEDGGAILWTVYYELMSRVRFFGADNAWDRFKQILARFDMPDHLVGGNPMYHGEIDNRSDGEYGPGSVGVWGEFPESGLVSCAFLYGVVGIRADVEGLHIRPNLPSGIKYAGVDGLVFRGRKLKVTSYPTHIKVEWSGRKLDLPVPPGGEATLTADTLDRR